MIKNMSSVDSANVLAKPIVADVKDTSIAPSLFKDHLLAVKNPKPEIHFTNYDYVITGILLFLYILFVWMYVSNYKKLSQIINGFYINRNSNQMSRDELSIGNRVSFFLSIFFIITLTIFISRIIAYYGLQFGISNSTVLNIIIGSGIIVAYSLKFASIKLLGYIFKVQREANDYMMTIFLFCNTLGLFMLPIVIGLTYVKQVSPVFFIYAGTGVIVIFFMVRMIRGLILGLNSSEISKIYLFMYLCTLEILPFVIMAKLFMLIVK
ncbi:MAG: DUF4271 domain-containing protein [Bacteroidetes bacterium]|nr:DUF4271 domain-containing protein [Bacteroidota bacterium]